jgi:hypothetical protein
MISAMNGEALINILERLLDSSQEDLSPAAAEAVLKLDLSSEDQSRITQLAEMSNHGTLSESDASEYDALIAAADFLSLWKSKARLSLKRQNSAA